MEENNLKNTDGAVLENCDKKETGGRKKKKLSGFQKGIVITSIAVFLLLVSAIIYIFVSIVALLDYNHNPITEEPEDLGFEEVIDEKIINIALFGIDSRNMNSFKGRSDSIMILSVNTKTKKIKIISILRDTLVPIERNGKITYTKINSAYSMGGPELAINTINKNFGLDISEYATVNFAGMADIIDAVGGIEITLIEDEVAMGYGTKGINSTIGETCNLLGKNPKDYYITEPGTYTLNGLQAVAYSRIRYVKNVWGTNNDYGRTDRQRFVMQQLFNKAKTLSKAQYVDLVKALIPCTETSLSPTEILEVAYKVMLNSPTFEQARVPLKEKGKDFTMAAPSGHGSVVYYDLGYASKIIGAFIYEDKTFDAFIAENPIEKNDWYRQAIGG